MTLTVTQIQNCKPQGKAVKLFDERGLYLEVTSNGGRRWWFKYRFGGKEKRISLGVVPDVGLKDARDRRDEARKHVADGYQGSSTTKCALILAPLLFVRPGELRKAVWSEVDLDGCEWRIPSERMKMNARHIVPLSQQAVAILRELQPLTGKGRYIFPGAQHRDRFMSENTVNGALRRLGYTNAEMTGHGFRSMASTLLNEQGWNRDAIERQLAHAERDSIRAAYNYAEHLPERRKMMQAWADYLGNLKAGAAIVPLHSSRAA